MGQPEKSRYYQALKAAGVKFDLHYREYTEEQLYQAWLHLPKDLREKHPVDFEIPEILPVPPAKEPVRSNKPLDVLAGVRRDNPEDEVIRVDDEGREWYQDEIRKSSIPKPRARRKLQYVETGVKEVEVRNGEYTETFEVAGDSHSVSEVRVTLPTYQVGRYRDPRFPFSVHIYNEQRGFDLFEVEDYYGGKELVPDTVKRIYIDSVLCYDMKSVINAIEEEARRLQLGI